MRNKCVIVYWRGHQSTKIFGKPCSHIAHFQPLMKCLWRFCALQSHLQLTSTALAIYGLFKSVWKPSPDNKCSCHTVFLFVFPYPEVKKKCFVGGICLHFRSREERLFFASSLLRNVYLTACYQELRSSLVPRQIPLIFQNYVHVDSCAYIKGKYY